MYFVEIFSLLLLVELGSSYQCYENCPIESNCNSCEISPINIITNRTVSISLPPLNFQNFYNNSVTMSNTGSGIVVSSDGIEAALLSGGPLCNDTYVYFDNIWYWTNSKGNRSAHAVNGEGTIITSISHYYNKKYGSYELGRGFFDGLCSVVSRITVVEGGPDNEEFEYFDKHLQNIRKAGSSTNMEFGNYTQWYYGRTNSPTFSYYFFKGIMDERARGGTDLCAYCATIFVSSSKQANISRAQFDRTFGSQEDVLGAPLTFSLSIYPQGNRLVWVTEGVTSVNIQ